MEDLIFGNVGVGCEGTPLWVRERVSFSDSQKMEFMEKLQEFGTIQCMVLSTCNRSELFFFCSEKNAKEIRPCYESMFPTLSLSGYLRERWGEEAMAYLFRVAAGLESVVLGEDQILGQVVEALQLSQTMGVTGKELSKIVRDAISCAKQIKTELKISERPLSVAYVGVQQLEKRCGGIRGKRILLLGSGHTAVLALAYLREHDPTGIIVCNRTDSRAKELSEKFPDIEVVGYDRRYEAMAGCEIVVSATAAPHPVVTKESYTHQVAAACDGKRYFLDLAAPRDVERELAERSDVEIVGMEQLEEITEENRLERQRLAKKSRPLVERAVGETVDWLHTSRMDDTIASLQKYCGEIVEDSYSYLERKLAFNEREGKILRKVLNSSLQRLLKGPIQELKHLETEKEQQQYRELIQRLFSGEGR